jgi:hypothetical protein
MIKKISFYERLKKKKNMGVWRWKSEDPAEMIIRFPGMVSRYMKMNKMKIRNCIPGSSINSKRINSETVD